jgi:hypothetical protein
MGLFSSQIPKKLECSSALKLIEKSPKNVKHLKVNLLAKNHFDCSYVVARCSIIGEMLFFFARARVLTINSPDGDKSVEGINHFGFPMYR